MPRTTHTAPFLAGLLTVAGLLATAPMAAGQGVLIMPVAPAPPVPPAEARPASSALPPLAQVAAPRDVPVLHLANQGFVAGSLGDAPDLATLRWQSPPFADPIDFPLTRVGAVRWPAPPRPVSPEAGYRLDLAGGDVVFGALVGVTEGAIEVDAAGLGRARLDRGIVRRIFRLGMGNKVIFDGPTGLAGWREPAPAGSWRDESGQLAATAPGATLRGDLGLPERAVVEFTLSWEGDPDFELALGVGDAPATPRQAFRITAWDGQFVAVREAGLTDLASLGPTGGRNGRLQLVAYLDQKPGRLVVAAPDGKVLADLAVPVPYPGKPPGGVVLKHLRGTTRLERLRISPWDGQLPQAGDAGQSRVRRSDGTVTVGDVVGYDPAAHRFQVREPSGAATTLAEDQVDEVVLADAGLGPAAVFDPSPAHRVALVDGARLSGTVRRINAAAVELAVPGIDRPLVIPTPRLQSLAVLHPEPATPDADLGRAGTLVLPGVKLPGALVVGHASPERAAVRWQADGGTAASLKPTPSGRVVYVETKPPQPAIPAPAAAQNNAPQAVVAFNKLMGSLAAAAQRVDQHGSLHLRTGDVIPCQVRGINEAGVTFDSPLATGHFAPNAAIKALELAPLEPEALRVGATKRERMLTLPRMQKGTPPTHLIRSTSGDYLRGRVEALDTDRLVVEVRLDSKEIPRDRIARIIWLHADELEAKGPNPKPGEPPQAAEAPPPAADPTPATRAQAIRADGSRLTFAPVAFEEGALAGPSPVFGDCRVRPDDVDQILLGSAIEASAGRSGYNRWVMHHAEEPKFVGASGGDGASAGTDSPLVGKDAPDFQLELLDGRAFHLADLRGQVVVLDFWATWCGPCVQAMPQVDRVAREFEDRGVRLVAVNLQEAPREIKAMLDRNKLAVTVALDRDGVVADRYHAVAIPQTVVIDRTGKVSRLFVGGGPDLEDQLRGAIKPLVEPAEK